MRRPCVAITAHVAFCDMPYSRQLFLMIVRRQDGSYRRELVKSTVYTLVPSLVIARVQHEEHVLEHELLQDHLRPGEELISLYTVVPCKRFVDHSRRRPLFDNAQ